MKAVLGARQGYPSVCYVLGFPIEVGFLVCGLAFACCLASFCQAEPHVDEVIGDHAQSNPSPHATLTAIATPAQSVPSLENADPAFASGAPALTFLERPCFLMGPPLLAPRVPVEQPLT